MKNTINTADLSQEEYKKFPFTWWQKNAIYIVGLIIISLGITLLFLSSCTHIIKIEGNKKGYWVEGHRVKVEGIALVYNSKTEEYKMECIDGWKIWVKASEITWK